MIVNVLAIGTAIARAPTLRGAWGEFVEMSGIVQPVVIVTVLALATLNGWLQRLRYPLGAAAVAALALGVTVLVLGVVQSAYQDDSAGRSSGTSCSHC